MVLFSSVFIIVAYYRVLDSLGYSIAIGQLETYLVAPIYLGLEGDISVVRLCKSGERMCKQDKAAFPKARAQK